MGISKGKTKGGTSTTYSKTPMVLGSKFVGENVSSEYYRGIFGKLVVQGVLYFAVRDLITSDIIVSLYERVENNNNDVAYHYRYRLMESNFPDRMREICGIKNEIEVTPCCCIGGEGLLDCTEIAVDYNPPVSEDERIGGRPEIYAKASDEEAKRERKSHRLFEFPCGKINRAVNDEQLNFVYKLFRNEEEKRGYLNILYYFMKRQNLNGADDDDYDFGYLLVIAAQNKRNDIERSVWQESIDNIKDTLNKLAKIGDLDHYFANFIEFSPYKIAKTDDSTDPYSILIGIHRFSNGHELEVEIEKLIDDLIEKLQQQWSSIREPSSPALPVYVQLYHSEKLSSYYALNYEIMNKNDDNKSGIVKPFIEYLCKQMVNANLILAINTVETSTALYQSEGGEKYKYTELSDKALGNLFSYLKAYSDYYNRYKRPEIEVKLNGLFEEMVRAHKANTSEKKKDLLFWFVLKKMPQLNGLGIAGEIQSTKFAYYLPDVDGDYRRIKGRKNNRKSHEETAIIIEALENVGRGTGKETVNWPKEYLCLYSTMQTFEDVMNAYRHLNGNGEGNGKKGRCKDGKEERYCGYIAPLIESGFVRGTVQMFIPKNGSTEHIKYAEGLRDFLTLAQQTSIAIQNLRDQYFLKRAVDIWTSLSYNTNSKYLPEVGLEASRFIYNSVLGFVIEPINNGVIKLTALLYFPERDEDSPYFFQRFEQMNKSTQKEGEVDLGISVPDGLKTNILKFIKNGENSDKYITKPSAYEVRDNRVVFNENGGEEIPVLRALNKFVEGESIYKNGQERVLKPLDEEVYGSFDEEKGSSGEKYPISRPESLMVIPYFNRAPGGGISGTDNGVKDSDKPDKYIFYFFPESHDVIKANFHEIWRKSAVLNAMVNFREYIEEQKKALTRYKVAKRLFEVLYVEGNGEHREERKGANSYDFSDVFSLIIVNDPAYKVEKGILLEYSHEVLGNGYNLKCVYSGESLSKNAHFSEEFWHDNKILLSRLLQLFHELPKHSKLRLLLRDYFPTLHEVFAEETVVGHWDLISYSKPTEVSELPKAVYNILSQLKEMTLSDKKLNEVIEKNQRDYPKVGRFIYVYYKSIKSIMDKGDVNIGLINQHLYWYYIIGVFIKDYYEVY